MKRSKSCLMSVRSKSSLRGAFYCVNTPETTADNGSYGRKSGNTAAPHCHPPDSENGCHTPYTLLAPAEFPRCPRSLHLPKLHRIPLTNIHTNPTPGATFRLNPISQRPPILVLLQSQRLMGQSCTQASQPLQFATSSFGTNGNGD